MISYNYVNLVTESVIFDEKPIFHNKEMWDKNESNIIFITGHSGAAKSTTGAKMATESYSLDDVIEQYRFSDENFKEYGDLIYSYFNSIGKKYRLSLKEIQNTTTEKTYEIPVLHNFIDYAIRYAKSHKNKKFCIEGIQLFQWFEPSEFKDYPVLILGTSVLKSNHRASKRDAADAESKLGKAGAYVKNILSIRHYKNYLDDEKYLKKWRKYFSDDKVKSITESMCVDCISDIFVEERANPLFVNFNDTKVWHTNTYIDISIIAKIKDSFIKSFNKDFNKFVDKLYKKYKISKSKFIDDLYIKNNTSAHIHNVDPDYEEQHYYWISIPIYSKELFKKDEFLDTIGLDYDFRFTINNNSIKVNRTDFIIDDDDFEIIKESSITESSISDNNLSNKEILDIIAIKKSLSDDDKKNLNMTSYKDYKTTGSKCFIEYDNNTPVAYSIVDIDKNNDADLSVACNPNYRGKGFAYKVLKKAVDYAKSHANNIYYATKANNIASQKLAKKVGLTKVVRDDKEWKTFSI